MSSNIYGVGCRLSLSNGEDYENQVNFVIRDPCQPRRKMRWVFSPYRYSDPAMTQNLRLVQKMNFLVYFQIGKEFFFRPSSFLPLENTFPFFWKLLKALDFTQVGWILWSHGSHWITCLWHHQPRITGIGGQLRDYDIIKLEWLVLGDLEFNLWHHKARIPGIGQVQFIVTSNFHDW